jgi:hypothetical protein
MFFKKGVLLEKDGVCVQPVTVEAMMKVAVVYYRMGLHDTQACITSVLDGKHMKGSKHYEGLAFDTRTWANSKGKQMSLDEKHKLATVIRQSLGRAFDVVVERDHLHIEYDPKPKNKISNVVSI